MSKTSRIFSHDEESGGEPERYRSLVEVGRGGMAVVYRAWDSHMDRDVALKVAREEVADDLEVRRRFGEESRIAAALTHPSILPVYDRGIHKGRPYLAMQFVDGVSLDLAKLPLREAIACLATAAEAVHHAHQQGIVHRDLKPSNILLGRDGRVYLTDFGVARQTVSDFRRTATGLVVGTPAYMSPEQARAEDVDARSDVYSLGATLYELAVGRPPYEGADPQAVLEALRSRPPVAPRKANSKVSRNVEAIIRMAMERLPQDRYATAQALAEDLKLYQNRRRPLARARGFRYYVGRELVRHPIRTAARTVSTLLLIGALVLGGLTASAYLACRKSRTEADLHTRLALLEKAADFWPPARQELKQLRDSVVAAENAIGMRKLHLLQQLGQLDLQIREALDRRDLPAADRLFADLRGLQTGANEELEKISKELHDRLWPLREEAAALIQSSELLAALRARLEEGNLDAAEAAWKRLSQAHPDRAGLQEQIRAARFREGAARLSKLAPSGDAAAFAALFAELAGPLHAAEKERDRSLGAAARARGLASAARGDRAETIRWLGAAEARGSADADLHRVRGLAHLAERNWNAAEVDLGRRRRLSPADLPDPPEYWELFHHRSREAAAAGRWNEAQDLLRDALKLSKEPAILWHDSGLARWKTVRRPELSLDELDQAFQRDPGLKPEAGYQEVVLALAEARFPEALELDTAPERDRIWAELLRRVEQVAGRPEQRREELRLLRATLLRRRLRFDEARRELDPVGDSGAIRLEAARVRLAASALSAEPQELLGEAYALVSGAPESAEILLWRGLLAARLGRDGALEDLQAAVEQADPFAAARLELARLLHARKQLRPSLRQLDLSLAGIKRPGHDDYLWLGAEPRGGALSEARAAWRRDTLVLRARVRYDAQNFAGCVDDCNLLLQQAVTPELLLLRGLAQRAMTPPAWLPASDDLEAYLKLRPGDVNARLAAAGAAYELKRYPDTEAHCKTIIEAGTKAPEPYYLRGLARKALGNAVGSKWDFDAALEKCPAGSPLRLKIDQERRTP